jgi:hypothetical protein
VLDDLWDLRKGINVLHKVSADVTELGKAQFLQEIDAKSSESINSRKSLSTFNWLIQSDEDATTYNECGRHVEIQRESLTGNLVTQFG